MRLTTMLCALLALTTTGLVACTDEDSSTPSATGTVAAGEVRTACDELGVISSLPAPPAPPLPRTPQAALARVIGELSAASPALASRTAKDFRRVPLDPQRYDEPAVRRGNASLAAYNPDGSVAVVATFAKFRGDGWALDEVETCRETDPASSYLRSRDPQVTCATGVRPTTIVAGRVPAPAASTPEEVMRQFVASSSSRDRIADRAHYKLSNFERIPGHKGEKASANLKRGAFAGYRPDGSVFVIVSLQRTPQGWVDGGVTTCLGPVE